MTRTTRSADSKRSKPYRSLSKDHEAEQVVLGSALLEAETVMPQVAEELHPIHFYLRAHRVIFQALIELFEAGQPIDPISIGNRLEEKNVLPQVGGRAYLSELTSAVTTTTSVDYYADIIVKKARLRSIIQIGQELTVLGSFEHLGVDEALYTARQKISELSQIAFGEGQHYLPNSNQLLKELLGDLLRKVSKELNIDPEELLAPTTSPGGELTDLLRNVQDRSVTLSPGDIAATTVEPTPGILLREVRQFLGYTQGELAELLGVQAQTISRWERGDTQPQSPLIQLYGDHDELEMRRAIYNDEYQSGKTRRTYSSFIDSAFYPSSIIEKTAKLKAEQTGYSSAAIFELEELAQKRKQTLENQYQRHYYFIYDKSKVREHIQNCTIPAEPLGSIEVAPHEMKELLDIQIDTFKAHNSLPEGSMHIGFVERTLPCDYQVISQGTSDEDEDMLFVLFRGIDASSNQHLHGLRCTVRPITDRFVSDFDLMWEDKITERDEHALEWLSQQIDLYLK